MTPPELHIRPKDASEAWQYVRYLVGRLPFYREHGYKVQLPDHPEMSAYIETPEAPGSEAAAKRAFVAHVYDASSFVPALAVIEAAREQAEQAILRLHTLAAQWSLPVPPRYDVLLTLYGMGGSYDVTRTRITMKVRHDGALATPPAHTIAHEIAHILVEQSLVQIHRLTHAEKEALVDRILQVGLADLLPGYEPQRVRDARMDAYITPDTITDLPAAVGTYVRERDTPRATDPA